MRRLLYVGCTLFVVIAVGCSSSPGNAGTTLQTGGTAGAQNGAGGDVHTGGAAATGGGNSSGAGASSGGSGGASAGGSSASAGRGGTGAGGATSGGAGSSSGGATASDSGVLDSGSDAGHGNLCGSVPCRATRCAGVGCGPAVCCEGPNGPVCIHGATECPEADGGVRVEKLQCVGGGASADFARSCSQDSECFVAQHWAGCCHIDAVGLNVVEKTAFASFETSCGGPPACGCCCDRIFTESGMTVASGTAIGVRCVGGTCTTAAP